MTRLHKIRDIQMPTCGKDATGQLILANSGELASLTTLQA